MAGEIFLRSAVISLGDRPMAFCIENAITVIFLCSHLAKFLSTEYEVAEKYFFYESTQEKKNKTIFVRKSKNG